MGKVFALSLQPRGGCRLSAVLDDNCFLLNVWDSFSIENDPVNDQLVYTELLVGTINPNLFRISSQVILLLFYLVLSYQEKTTW